MLFCLPGIARQCDPGIILCQKILKLFADYFGNILNRYRRLTSESLQT